MTDWRRIVGLQIGVIDLSVIGDSGSWLTFTPDVIVELVV
jgi:hypothetical protein